jgi:uncharacterized protein YodC (DUF2158 family)
LTQPYRDLRIERRDDGYFRKQTVPEETKWKPGDVVRVKSGGPRMTVGSISKAGRVVCEWFDAAGKPQRAFLSPGALVDDASDDASLREFRKLIDRST